MNHKRITLWALAVWCLLFCASLLCAKDNVPTVKAIAPQFEFTPVVEGKEVVHDFIIQNTGTAPLEITNVKPG